MAASSPTEYQVEVDTLARADPGPIPKVELHCHLDGILDPAILRQLHARGDAFGVSARALERAYPVTDAASFWRWLEVQQGLQGGLDAYRPILAAHIDRLRAQHVVYTEIMLGSSELWLAEPSDALERFRDFREYASGLERGDLQIEFIAGWNHRPRPGAEVDAITQRILMLYEAGLIAGAFLAGPEAGNPVRRFADTFARFRAAGIPVEIHAGEWCGPESVWDALEFGHPQRIGHGVAIFDDARLVDYVRSAGVHVEMCPTSNLRTGAIPRIQNHPIGRANAAGLSFSLNSDDPGAFAITLDDEFGLVARTFGLAAADFQRIAKDALAARFQPVLRHANARSLAGD